MTNTVFPLPLFPADLLSVYRCLICVYKKVCNNWYRISFSVWKKSLIKKIGQITVVVGVLSDKLLHHHNSLKLERNSLKLTFELLNIVKKAYRLHFEIILCLLFVTHFSNDIIFYIKKERRFRGYLKIKSGQRWWLEM